jgi:hypothetical protein
MSDTNFSLLGARDYVHSSSIIEYIYNNYDDLAAWPMGEVLLDIKFYNKFSSNCFVIVLDAPIGNISEDIVSEAVIRNKSDKRFVYFKRDPNSSDLNSIDVRYDVDEIERYGDFSGRYKIKSESYTQFIRNLIEANKKIHLQDDKLKGMPVINVYMRSVPIYLYTNNSWADLVIKNIGSRSKKNSVTTLNKIKFLSSTGAEIELDVCFSVSENS